MKNFARWAIALCCWLNSISTHALDSAGVQRLLAASNRSDVRYTETRESPWLAAPVESRGTLSWAKGRLEKRVELPRQETWRIFEDRMQWVSGDGSRERDIPLEKAPGPAAFAEALRLAVLGDITGLERRFVVAVSGSESAWVVTLTPREAGFARLVESIEMKGASGRLLELVVVEPRGERTTTRLLH